MHSSASRRTDRAAAATGALLLQLGFIAAFVHGFSAQAPSRQLQHELTFFLPRLPKPEPLPSKQAPRAAAPVVTSPVFAPPPVVAAPLPEAPSAQALQNFGQALQGCAPEDYANLSPDRKSRCSRPGEGVAIQQAPNLMGSPSHVKDEAHWDDALTHKKSPLLLPGTSPHGFGIKLIGIDTDGKVTGLANASADPETWPTYDVTTYGARDFYKREQDYEAWHKNHPTAQASAKAAENHPK